jgi:hypothetical protein
MSGYRYWVAELRRVQEVIFSVLIIFLVNFAVAIDVLEVICYKHAF